MKIGFSSYSFHQAVSTGRMTLPEVVDWIADHGGEHLELAVGFGSDNPLCDLSSLPDNPQLAEALLERTAARGIALSQVAAPALLWAPDQTDDERATQIARLKRLVDTCAELGIGLMRHDVAMFSMAEVASQGDDLPAFDEGLPVMAAGAKEVAQYAATKGITTSLENHGYFVQLSERVRRVVQAVDEPNFGTTLDIGNFACVDEDSVVAVKANLPYASIVHLKDFYFRDRPGAIGWFPSKQGRWLRGAIVGEGDLNTVAIAKQITDFGWDGFVSIEFEGIEDCLVGCEAGLANARRLLGQENRA